MKREIALWSALLIPPVVWFMNLLANFALAPFACGYHWWAVLHVISLVCVLIAAACAILAWRQWQYLGREVPSEGSGAARARIMALGGVALSSMFVLVILAMWLAQAILGACG
jgi:hypothetical protein